MVESVYNHFNIFNIEKIIIVRSSIEKYDVIKIYEHYCENEISVTKNTGVKWVFDNILNKGVDYKPEVWVHDVQARVLTYKLEV